MGRYRASTGLREIINEKRSISLGVAILMLLLAGIYFAFMQRPQPRSKGDKVFYTVDDGQTWFIDSIYKTPPFDHDGKIAVRAMVCSYDNGRRQFCPFVQQYKPDMKETLDELIAQANRGGKPLSSIGLFGSPELMDGIEIKASGPGHDWVSRSNKEQASKILNGIKSPDGSAVEFVVP
jgi:hypothetical protein